MRQQQHWQEVALAAAAGGCALCRPGHGLGQKILEGLQDNLQGFQQSASASRARIQQGLCNLQRQPQPTQRDLERMYGKADPLAALIPGNSAAEQVLTSGLSSTLSLYNTAIIGRLLLTWFPNPPAALASPLSTLCDPYLNLFRGLIPPIGGTLDLSPILALVVLDLFTNTAGALPAEMGPDGKMAARKLSSPTKAASAWRRRIFGQQTQQMPQSQE